MKNLKYITIIVSVLFTTIISCKKETQEVQSEGIQSSLFTDIYNNYFNLKNSLVGDDSSKTAQDAANLLTAIESINQDNLSGEAKDTWFVVYENIKKDAEHISKTNAIDHQRKHFISLSKNMYELMKVSKSSTPTYYQFCPMANNGEGAYWLSENEEIKNPYFGSEMLTCGSVAETIE